MLSHLAFAALCYLVMFLLTWLNLPGAFDLYSDSPNLGFFLVLAMFNVGLAQILYAVPLWLWLRRKGRFDTAKGIAIGSVITVLINGSCFIFLLNP